jgi:hypothetical protein
MSFEAAWGFDPDKAMQANGLPRPRWKRPICTHRFMSSGECIGSDAIVEDPAAGRPTYSPERPFQ